MEELSFDNYPNFRDHGDPDCVQYPADMFFPDIEGPNYLHMLNVARRVCVGCPYQLACLTYAIEENLEGVWGGTSDFERRKLKSLNKIELPDPNRRGVAPPKKQEVRTRRKPQG